MQAEKPKEQWLYNGTLDCAVKIVKDEGTRSPQRSHHGSHGCTPTALSSDCCGACCFCYYLLGMGAMFKGFGANVLRTLGGALVLVGYDEIKRMIGQ